MDKEKLEEMNLRLQVINNGLDALLKIKTIESDYHINKYFELSNQRKTGRQVLENARENITKELAQLEEFKVEERIEQQSYYHYRY